MQRKCVSLFSALIFFILFAVAPKTLLATNITLNVPHDFSTIQAAIDDAALQLSINPGNSYSVLVEPGTYPGGIVLKTDIPVAGRETARTIISGGGTGTAVTANGVTGVNFRNFTIMNASTGILVTGNSTMSITNNVFQVGTGSIAVQIQNSPATSVVNNTFYQNGTAIQSDSGSITNNIFYNSANTVQINQSGTTQTITYNLFFPDINGPTGTHFIPDPLTPGLDPEGPDPLFVDPVHGDFHIQLRTPTPSPCVDQGDPLIKDSIDQTRSDIGAYGGTNADSIPFPVSILSSSATTSSTISVSWTPNNSYLVTDSNKPGSYNVLYTFGTTTAAVNVVSTMTSTTLSGLTSTVPAPPVPTITLTSPHDGALDVSWTSSSGATGYKIHYGIASVSENTIDVGFTTSFTLFGLTNGQKYQIAVSAYALPIYLISVSALDNVGSTYDPGVQHESFYSPQVSVPVGVIAESADSAIVTDFPEAIVAYPNLPNKGCFIATAAYGYYSAPQVQALRLFRDRYLLTNEPGRAFVGWYYRYGPIGAEFINAHSWTKPLVRIALMPTVGVALFMTRTSFLVKLLIMMLSLISIAAYTIRRKKRFRAGGVR
jgi:hypothetical protein